MDSTAAQERSIKELRIGLVLYGGVSLAIYMNGVVTELWHLLRASKARADGSKPEGGTAQAYLTILEELGRDADLDLRVVVDTIAGSSAGGVNGAALGKAIAEGADATLLNKVWIESADISELRDDSVPKAPIGWFWDIVVYLFGSKVLKAIRGMKGLDWFWVRDQAFALVKGKDPLKTPLRGDRFVELIAETFENMTGKPDGRLLPTRGRLDLFLTQTDLSGWSRHLPVSPRYHPKALSEQAYAHRLRFQAERCLSPDPAAAPKSDFTAEGNFALTFAARSTAGFPGAFAPLNSVGLDRVAWLGQRPQDGDARLSRFHRKHLPEHVLAGLDPTRAWMVDGGVLDNKPFTYVTQAIEGKPADFEVTRAVVYLEPDPPATPPQLEMPPPTLALLGKLVGLLRSEPIIGDLERLRERNAHVQRIRDIALAEEPRARKAVQAAGAGLAFPPQPADLAAWHDRVSKTLAQGGEAGYAGYTGLKARRAAEVIAEAICLAFNYPFESTPAFLLRAAIRAWLAREGILPSPEQAASGERQLEDQRALLGIFDRPFRLRRLRFLVQRVNGLYKRLGDVSDADRRDLRKQLDGIKRLLSDVAFAYEALTDSEALEHDILTSFSSPTVGAELDHALRDPVTSADSLLAGFQNELTRVRDSLEARFAAVAEQQQAALIEGLQAACAELEKAGAGAFSDEICLAYALFPYVDLVVFPLMDAANLQDLLSVEVMRISPRDTETFAERRQPLQSLALGAFGGFLDRAKRENDLLWGRLDGAERLVDLLAEAAGQSARRDELRRIALRAVLDDYPATEALRGVIQELRARLA